MSASRARLKGLVLSLLAAVSACGQCGDEVAVLERSEGEVDRRGDGDDASWADAPIGTEFVLGEAARTAARSTATLMLASGGALGMEPETIVEFRRGTGERTALRMLMGELTIEELDEALEIETDLGPLVLEPRSSARLERTERDLRLHVLIGRARLEPAEGGPVIEQGHTIRIEIGGAIIEEISAADGDAEAPRASSTIRESATDVATDVVADVEDQERELVAVGPVTQATGDEDAAERLLVPELVLPAGEAAVIHDPEGRTIVAIDAPEDCTGPRIEIGGSSTVGPRAIARLGRGRHSARVRCAAGRTLRSALVVRRSAGSVPLPRGVRREQIATDGRSNNLRYQSQPPELDVRWPDAPAGQDARYVLHVDSDRGTDRAVRSTPPAHVFASGEIGDGTHRFWFVAPGGETSPVTTIRVRFDNQSPSAYIREPAANALPASGLVRIEGIAVPGWTASANGAALSMDGSGRFSGEVAVPSDGRVLAIRVGKPGNPAHYFLRRTPGDP